MIINLFSSSPPIRSQTPNTSGKIFFFVIKIKGLPLLPKHDGHLLGRGNSDPPMSHF